MIDHRLAPVAAFIAICLIAAGSAMAQAVGRYVGKVQASWDQGGRTMTLLAPFEYVDARNTRWIAPKGVVVDGASIPQFAWSVIGGPFEGRYREASVIHDAACLEKKRPWNVVHETFYWAMLTSGVTPSKAKVMYAAVYHFGPRWSTPSALPGGAIDVPPVNQMTKEDFDRLKAEIEAREHSGATISLREIRSFAK